MKQIGVLLMVLAVGTLTEAADHVCKLTEGLFQQRQALTTQLNSAITRNDTTEQQKVQARIKSLDRQYYGLMDTISVIAGRGDTKSLNDCCSQSDGDPVKRLICRLALYRTKQISSRQFIDQFPSSAVDRQALWLLDEVANVQKEPEKSLQIFGSEGPANLYIGELFTLAKRNDPPAMKKYMNLYSQADGQYAELMEDQLEHLFLEHTEIVIHNWDSIKTNHRALNDLKASLSPDQKRQINSEAKKYCSSNAGACRELSVALKK